MGIKLLAKWFDMWVGLFVDTAKRRLYVFPVPMLGFYIQFPTGAAWLAWKLKWFPVQRIRDLDGKLKLTRVKLTPKVPWLGQLFLHVFHATEDGMDLHDHAYDYATFPFRGYIERAKIRPDSPAWNYVTVPAWRWTRRRAEHTHVVIAPLLGRGDYVPQAERFPFATLFWNGPQRRKWGFHTKVGWVYWKDYYARRQAV